MGADIICSCGGWMGRTGNTEKRPCRMQCPVCQKEWQWNGHSLETPNPNANPFENFPESWET